MKTAEQIKREIITDLREKHRSYEKQKAAAIHNRLVCSSNDLIADKQNFILTLIDFIENLDEGA